METVIIMNAPVCYVAGLFTVNAKVTSCADLVFQICHCGTCTSACKECDGGSVWLGCVQQTNNLGGNYKRQTRKAAAKTIKPALCVPKGHLFINSSIIIIL